MVLILSLFISLYLSHTSSEGPVLGACRAFFHKNILLIDACVSHVLQHFYLSAFTLILSVWTFRVTFLLSPRPSFTDGDLFNRFSNGA